MSATPCMIGIGSPIVDILAQVSEDFLSTIPGAKGGMELIDAETMAGILDRLSSETVKAPGGSAGNTAFAMARLGMACTFLGKLGEDPNGHYYRESFSRLGGDATRFKTTSDAPTATCLSLITPDSERTMRTDLGASAAFLPAEVSQNDFRGCTHAHVEGYLLFNPDLILAVLRAAKAAGCTISLDLASFEVVRASATALPVLLRDYVDMVFANEDEAKAFCGDDDPEAGLEALSNLCAVAAVKLGKEGAVVRRDGVALRAAAVQAPHVVDTTGAGDFWAAGFLYGHLNGFSLEACARCASIMGAEAVQQVGTFIPSNRWPGIRAAIDAATC